MSKPLQYLVIHCTATPEGNEVSSEQIRHMHTDPKSKGGRGWKQVGYTDMIHLDGKVERLVNNNEDANVDPWEITNGAKGYNAISRHIVYVGGLKNLPNVKYEDLPPKDTRTPKQKAALKRYVLDFHKRFPKVKIIGHNQVANKDCPSFDVPKWLQEIGINQ